MSENRIGELNHRIQYYEKGAQKQNFGDFLPVLIADALFTQPRIEADIYLLLGSCIASSWIRNELRTVRGRVSGTIAFWGCGMRNETPLDPDVRARSLFFGARGKKTRDALNLPSNTPLGDPGLLMPLIHDCAPHEATYQKLICCPHFQDQRSDDEIKTLSGVDVIVRPTIDGNIEALHEIINKITSAKFVLAGSLHAGVIACAYDIPFAFWHNGHLDIPFKYEDFSSSIDIPTLYFKTVREALIAYDQKIKPSIKRPKLSPILDVCPFNIRTEAKLRALNYDGEIDSGTYNDAARALEMLQMERRNAICTANSMSGKWIEERTSLKDIISTSAARVLHRRVRWLRAHVGRLINS